MAKQKNNCFGNYRKIFKSLYYIYFMYSYDRFIPKRLVKPNLHQKITKKPLFPPLTCPNQAFLHEIHSSQKIKSYRKTDREVIQVLDCPDIVDNFYHSVFDWSKNDLMCLALEDRAYLLEFEDRTDKLKLPTQAQVTSMKFDPDGEVCFVGDDFGIFSVYDTVTNRRIRTIQHHLERIGCIESIGKSLILCGSKDHSLTLHDLRQKSSLIFKFVSNSECCGIANNGSYFASGFNNSTLNIWDCRNLKVMRQLKNHHQNSAIKALSWCPQMPSILVSGGGRTDSRIIFYDCYEDAIKGQIPTQSQITKLVWRPSDKLLFSSHGDGNCFGWNTKTGEIEHCLDHHRGRIMGMCFSPLKKDLLCTVGADEQIVFWDTKRDEKEKPKFECELDEWRTQLR